MLLKVQKLKHIGTLQEKKNKSTYIRNSNRCENKTKERPSKFQIWKKNVQSVKLEDLDTLQGAESVFENASAQAEECLAKNPNVTGNYCPAFYDGLLCWDPTPWHTLAVQKCFSELNGLQYDDTRKYLAFCKYFSIFFDNLWFYFVYLFCFETQNKQNKIKGCQKKLP